MLRKSGSSFSATHNDCEAVGFTEQRCFSDKVRKYICAGVCFTVIACLGLSVTPTAMSASFVARLCVWRSHVLLVYQRLGGLRIGESSLVPLTKMQHVLSYSQLRPTMSDFLLSLITHRRLICNENG